MIVKFEQMTFGRRQHNEEISTLKGIKMIEPKPIDYVKYGWRKGKLSELAGDICDEQFNDALHLAHAMVTATSGKTLAFYFERILEAMGKE